MNCRKVFTASGFCVWLEAYQTPPPTLPVTLSPFDQVSGAAAAHWPGLALTLAGFWNSAPAYQAGPGIATRWSALATNGAPNTESWVSVPFLSMWSMRSDTFLVFGSSMVDEKVSPLSWNTGASPLQ